MQNKCKIKKNVRNRCAVLATLTNGIEKKVYDPNFKCNMINKFIFR